MAQYSVAIPVSELKAGMVLAEPIHIINDRGVNMTFAMRNTRLSDRFIARLQSHNIKEAKVLSESPAPLKTKPAIKLASPPRHVPPKSKFSKFAVKPLFDEEFKEESVMRIRNMFDAARNAGTDENLTTAYQVVKDLDDVVFRIVNTLESGVSEFVHINDIKSYDEYTYHHSLSVAVLSVAIGQEMSLGTQDLNRLCRCALLHDIGKIWVPHDLITKPGRLERHEFEQVKKHAINGGQYLKGGAADDMQVLLGVVFHHEKYDGSGYPKNLKKDEIPLFSRVISVADVYDAVTSMRPYRQPMVPADALDLVLGESGTSFDPEVVQAFKRKLDLYPINTVVELSDKRLGIVANNSNSRRPTLRMVDGEIIDLGDLRNLSLVITKIHSLAS